MKSLKSWLLKHRKPFSFVIYFLCIFIPVIYSVAFAQTSCSYTVNEAWKSHFPFDLVYPVGVPYVPSDACPVVNFWGQERPVCSIKQVTAIVKNLVLARTAIKGIFSI